MSSVVSALSLTHSWILNKSVGDSIVTDVPPKML